MALAAASPAATWAANGVDLRDPLKPRAPADDQAMTFPAASVMVIMVLLKVAATWTTPVATFFLTRFFPFLGVTGEAVTGSRPPRLGTAGAAASAASAFTAFSGDSAFLGGFSGFSVGCFSSATLMFSVGRPGRPVAMLDYALGAGAAAALRTMPRFGPLRVRALVWVRWPRTGSPLRWRRPR
jgi:hypothetical protein